MHNTPASTERPHPRCPRCGYDLSGLVDSWSDACPLEGVCPECGLRLRWRLILGPGGSPPAWSVEHAPIRRVPLAAAATAIRVARPIRLFRRLRMHHEVRAGRLVAFSVLLFVPAWVAWGLVILAEGLLKYWIWYGVALKGRDFARLKRRVTVELGALFTRDGGGSSSLYLSWDPVAVGAMGMIAGLALTAIVVRSARRPRVRVKHLLRVAALSLAPVGLYAMLAPLDVFRDFIRMWGESRQVGVDAIWFETLTAYPRQWRDISPWWRVLTLGALCSWTIWFWAVALRVGLELRRIGPALLAGTVVGALTAASCAMFVDLFFFSALFRR